MSMRGRPLGFLLFSAVFFACNGSGPVRRPTGGEGVASTVWMIDPAKDTVVTTPGGALITIPAGTLEITNSGVLVRLEIKEAYVLEEMVKGKLLVPSGQAPLSSAGILFLNATADGEAVTIGKPIKVQIPTKFPHNGMMVFTGSVDDSSALSWASPAPLEGNPASRQLDNGHVVFMTNCASCHSLQGNVSGPPLAWITSRRDRRWLFEYTRNSARMLWRGDAYSCYLFNRYSKRSMEIFPNLSDSALTDLYQYIAFASQRIDSTTVPDQKRGFDSCAVNDPNCSGVANKKVEVAATATGSDDSASAASAAGISSVSYYTFNVNSWGWYNVAQRAPGKGDDATDADSAYVAGGGESIANEPATLQACPCWCDESAYRKADSVARAHSAPRPKVVIPR